MNWLLRKSDKFTYHTNLNAVLAPILEDLASLNWLISDLDYMYWEEGIPPVNLEDDYFVLSPEQFTQLVEAKMQFVWGVLLGIPADCSVSINTDDLPDVDINLAVWKNGNLQHPDAIIEVVCFDSSYTIVKFKDEALSAKFKAYFAEAVELEKF